MNAVALVDGWVRGGPEGARQRLHDFWRAVARNGRFSPIQRTPWDMLLGNWSVENSPGYWWYDTMSRAFSPYVANPLDINPLRDVVEAEIDFEKVRLLRGDKAVHFGDQCRNRARSGCSTRTKSTLDVVMASACLPQIFQAVEIDGTPYWDGGYGGNPAIFPFFYATETGRRSPRADQSGDP